MKTHVLCQVCFALDRVWRTPSKHLAKFLNNLTGISTAYLGAGILIFEWFYLLALAIYERDMLSILIGAALSYFWVRLILKYARLLHRFDLDQWANSGDMIPSWLLGLISFRLMWVMPIESAILVVNLATGSWSHVVANVLTILGYHIGMQFFPRKKSWVRKGVEAVQEFAKPVPALQPLPVGV